MKIVLRVLTVIAAVILTITAGFVTFDFFQSRGNFPQNVYIGKIDVSGLSQAQACEELSRFGASTAFSPLVTFEAESSTFSFTPEAVGISIDRGETVKQAYRLTHDEGYLKELRTRLTKGIHCPLYFKVNTEPINNLVEVLSSMLRTTAKDASFLLNEETGGYHIESEELGREVNKEKTIDLFKKRLSAGERTFPIIIKYQHPRITEKILRAAPPAYRLSAYTTYYGRHDSPNRIHNIKLIASWIAGTLLMPGDHFSVADILGEITPERGFKEAFVIMQGVLVPLLGGGSCQIATTLYNTVALSDLKILQRKNHSFYFNIYPLGRDAGVFPGQLDFRFENDSGHPILIKSVATNKRLSFRIYGTPTGKKVVFSSPSVYLLTRSGYVPATVGRVLASDAPFKTFVTRTVYDAAGNKIKEETIQSFYKLYGEKTNVPIARPEPR